MAAWFGLTSAHCRHHAARKSSRRKKITSRVRALKVFIKSVTLASRPQVVVSRTSEEMVKKLFTLENSRSVVPARFVTTMSPERPARAPRCRFPQRRRTSIRSVRASGQRGTRIQTIISELGGEKIDIIPILGGCGQIYRMALAPAKVGSVELNDAEKIATVTVPATASRSQSAAADRTCALPQRLRLENKHPRLRPLRLPKLLLRRHRKKRLKKK